MVTSSARSTSARNSRPPIAPANAGPQRSEEELDRRDTIGRLAEAPSPCATSASFDTPPPDEPRRVGSDAEAPPGAGASAAVRARPFAAVPPTARRGTRFLRTQPAESGGSVFFLAGPRSPSFRHFVSRGIIATVAFRTAQLLHILVPSPHRLARVRSIGEDEATDLAGIAARACRAICGGGRPRDSTATA